MKEMIRIFFTLIAFILLSITTIGQHSVSSTGAYYTTANCSLSMTAGESVTATYIIQNNVLNTGFQQANTFIPITRTWNGSVDDNWSVAANWTAAGVPVSIDDVSIPVSAPRMPVVRIDGLSCLNIDLETGAGLTVSSGIILRITGN